MFFYLKQNDTVIKKQDLYPKQISNFRLSTELSVLYHDQMDIIKQATTKNLMSILKFSLISANCYVFVASCESFSTSERLL